MAISAKATYFATQEAGIFYYVFLIENTSGAPYDIFSALIGEQSGAIVAGVLQNLIPISAPPGWQIAPTAYDYLSGSTNWAGTPGASGYIMPGDVGTFLFSSTTAPPRTLPFNVAFYDGGTWGAPYNGTAEEVNCVPVGIIKRVFNQKSIVLTSIAHQQPDMALAGTTTRTLSAGEDGPSVTINYDRFGNIIRMVPHPRLTQLQPR
jgi:hypothetical protein